MSKANVLDAWAILALLQKEEPAASRVRDLLQEALTEEVELFVSIINLGEVIYRVGKAKGEEQAAETLDQIRLLPLVVIPASEEVVWSAVRFKMHYSISYADAFAAATADRLDAILVTGDPELLSLEGQIAVERLDREGRFG